MHLALIEQIRVRQNRNRKAFDEDRLKELAESIATTGLLHLPVVRALEDGSLELLAGERRMRAMQILWAAGRSFAYEGSIIPQGQLPYSLQTELSELSARAIELEENIIRIDLTWQERVVAIAELHALRKAQDPSQTYLDTGTELGFASRSYASTAVKNAEILSRHLDDAVVMKAKSPDEAMKALSRKMEAEMRAFMVLAGDDAPKSHHTLVHGDMADLMPTLPPSTFEIIITDPPYGVNAETFRANMVVMHEYDDDWDSTEHKIIVLAAEGLRVTKPQAHAYVFCDVLMFPAIRDIFDDAGWDVWPRPLIWVKDVGHIPAANLGPQRRYECILYANKGKKPVNMLAPDVISVPAVNEKHHAAEKPVDLYLNLLRRSSTPGDRILDPFCGSGPVFEAAEKLQCIATGYDSDPLSVQLSQERIKGL